MLFERSLAGMYRSTLDGRLLECNDAFARIFGYASRAEYLRHATTALYVDSGAREAFVSGLRETGRLADFENSLRRADGTVVWVLETRGSSTTRKAVLRSSRGRSSTSRSAGWRARPLSSRARPRRRRTARNRISWPT